MADTQKLEALKKLRMDSEEKGGPEPEPQREFSAPSLPVETVVVYLDRAEVCRSFKANVKQGENELIVKNLSQCIDKDSIRVEGRGSATITEVSLQTKHLKPEETSSQRKSKQDELQWELDSLLRQQNSLEKKKLSLVKQRSVLDGFADSVAKAPTSASTTSKAGEKTTVGLSDQCFQSMVYFFEMYDKQALNFDTGLLTVDADLAHIQKQIDAVRRNMHEMNVSSSKEVKELSILLDCHEASEVELYVSYVVFKAKWTPKYDIRVFSNDGQLKILYFGMVQQSSGEDWDDAKLCLSTATPSVGGNVPDLETQKLSFKPKIILSSELKDSSSQDTANAGEMEMGDYLAEVMPEVELIQHGQEVKESIATTMYEIAHRSSIPSDNVAHKVSVAIIDLKPTFEYECVPRKSNHAYLKARVKNTSPYAILAGPTNVFLDNNFISKSELNAVSPMEEFDCSLGVDPAVKVTYKPLNKYREQSGLISKSVSTVYKQVTELKNTRQDAIKILMKDQLPLSTEEKIKVVLIEPNLKHTQDPSKPIRLNKQNNLEWDLELKPSESKEVVLKYSVEHPANETVETTMVSEQSEC